MMRRTTLAILVLTAAAAAVAGGGPPAGHPALQPRLAADAEFPLYPPDSLAVHGYPDHQHEFFWPGWTPPTDENGEPYGIGTFCRGILDLEREGLVKEPGLLRFEPFVLAYNDTVPPCYVAPFLGLCEMARRDAADLLGLGTVGELRLFNPDGMDVYGAYTGYGVWRMFRRDGDDVVLQPVHILAQRSLIGHAARDLILGWALEAHGGAELPAWFREGLAVWFAEMGVHLNNYMAQFRPEGPVLLGPAAVESILAGPVDGDSDRDRKMFRQARFGAFLMMWELIENRGGLTAMRSFLQAVDAGDDPDAAAHRVWDADLSGLARQLDPRTRPEPLGDAVVSRNPARPPR